MTLGVYRLAGTATRTPPLRAIGRTRAFTLCRRDDQTGRAGRGLRLKRCWRCGTMQAKLGPTASEQKDGSDAGGETERVPCLMFRKNYAQ